ncbi:MAG: APC family permease [Firmicutes bacterium]|nr:APC family permease [Bacillota bacterium]MDD7602562.1 APC family permease [Bacillota bacterium]MDY5856825.1 APC family permease [Anaerovoracaceae bacterium]
MSTDNKPAKVEMKKEIGVFGGISIIGGIMIGSGIFYLGSYVLQRTGMSMGLALLCWIIGGIVSILGGLCFAELGACDPKSGGMVVYLNRAFHPSVGYSFGFTSWIISGSGSIAALAIALPTALRNFVDLSDVAVKVIAIVLIIGLTAYNCLGIKMGSILQNVSMVAKMIPIAIILLAGLFLGKQTPDLSLVPEGTDVSFGSMLGMIAFATVATLWAYEGWTNLNPVAEEMKNPGRDLPRALIIGISAITVLYTLFNFAIYRVLPHEQVVDMINNDNLYLGTEVAKSLFGNAGGGLILATQLIAIFGALNGMIIAFPRYYYEMALDGHFFKNHAKLHPKYAVPHVALFSQAVISIILVLLRNLDQLTSLVVFAGMVYNVLVIIAVIIYRKKFPDMERPYKAWGYPVTVVIAIVLFGALMINTLVEDPMTAIFGLIVPFAGILCWYIFDRRLKKEGKQE